MVEDLLTASNRQPLGNFETRCDDKGRIRIPSSWVHFVTHDLKDQKIFATSLDGRTIRMYPESIWRYNLALFEELSEQSAEVEAVLELANHFGTETELDSNGRVLIKPELRAALELVGDEVVGTGKKGVIHVLRKADHEARIRGALATVPEAIQVLTRLKMR